ncbi:xylulose 5-phosphate/phosphate translocator, partial [Striga asiatica]
LTGRTEKVCPEKSAEPVFSVVFSTFLGNLYPLKVFLLILPVVFGCSLAAVTISKYNLVVVPLPGGYFCGGISVGPRVSQGYIAATRKPLTFYMGVMLSGICNHLYNQSSYEELDDISRLTFSVGNTMKRVIVVVAAVLVFKNSVRLLNALGSAIAIFGTFLYLQATAKKPKVERAEQKD